MRVLDEPGRALRRHCPGEIREMAIRGCGARAVIDDQECRTSRRGIGQVLYQ